MARRKRRHGGFIKNTYVMKRYLAFKKYLRKHADVAQAYACIKRCLAEQFPKYSRVYADAKDSFIRAIDYRTGNPRYDQLEAKDEIFLESYNPNWKKLFLAEANAIKQFVKLPYLALEHLGSTAIEGLSAKPTIDIFIALENMQEANAWVEPLKALGYVDWPDNPDKNHARFFKGMPPFGIHRTHHIHLMPMNEDFKNRVAFRDFLRENITLRKQYETLKQTLAKKYEHDREAYTDAKAEFVKAALNKNK